MKLVCRRSFLGAIPGAVLLGAAAQQTRRDVLPNRPKVPGTLSLRARRRTKEAAASEQALQWRVARTAIVICDMWDTHTCGTRATGFAEPAAAGQFSPAHESFTQKLLKR